MILYNTPDDISWILETHLRYYEELPSFLSFTLVGNEDSPEKVILYKRADPLTHDSPVAEIVLKED